MRALRAAVLVLGLAACDNGITDVRLQPGEGTRIPGFAARATFVSDGYRSVSQPVGHPAVRLTWELPQGFQSEVFRVYGRRSTDTRYALLATVTSCAASVCSYTDANVSAGTTYDYYIASVDESAGRELASSDVVRVSVPNYTVPAAPTITRAVGLDGAVFLKWNSTGAERYRVFLERQGSDSVFFEIGSTDGDGYLDLRATNGTRYGYRVAAVDTSGVSSARSALAVAVPRPDFYADLLYPLSQNADSSGFRFVNSDAESPTLPGASASANWRLEVVNGTLSIVPLGQTAVTPGRYTTALTCGPASESNCVSVDQVTPDLAFGSSPVAVRPGYTYVFRVGSGASAHYGKVRIEGVPTDGLGRQAVVFDWAYQLIAGELRLTTAPMAP